MKSRLWRIDSKVGVEDTFWVVEVWGAMCRFHWESYSCWDRVKARLGVGQMGMGGEMDWMDGWLLYRWGWPGCIVEADILCLWGGERRGVCVVRVDSPDDGGVLRWSLYISARRRSCGNWGRFVPSTSQLQPCWEAQRGWRVCMGYWTPGQPGRSLGEVPGAAAIGGVGLLWFGGGAFAACVQSVVAMFLTLFLALFLFVACPRFWRRRRDRRFLFMYLRWSPL
jgi:hypothetical protein